MLGRKSTFEKRSIIILVLSRKKDEKIIIGDGDNKITIMIIEIRGDKCRLGIEAPKEIPINREEVWAAIQKENEEKTNNEKMAST